MAKRRQGRTFNRKSDISPAAFKKYLPWISIVQPIWGNAGLIADARVHLHGSGVASAYSDNTNRLVSEIHQAHVAERVIASMQRAIDTRQAVIGVSEERKVEPPHVRLNILYLPLSNDDSSIDLFFSYARLDPID